MEAKDVLERVKRARETKEAVAAFFAENLPGYRLTQATLGSWTMRYDLDAIITALEQTAIQYSKREDGYVKGGTMTQQQVMDYASSVMRNLRDKGLSEEERAHLHRMRSEAGKKGAAARWDVKK